jgi:hypothetical protein
VFTAALRLWWWGNDGDGVDGDAGVLSFIFLFVCAVGFVKGGGGGGMINPPPPPPPPPPPAVPTVPAPIAPLPPLKPSVPDVVIVIVVVVVPPSTAMVEWRRLNLKGTF